MALLAATDGVAAMDFLYQRGAFENAPRPDLIILDLSLPKKDGRDVLDEIKKNDQLRPIPVVVLSASTTDTDIIRSYYHHANAYIIKPIELDDFVRMVHTIGEFWLFYVKLPGKPRT